MLTRKIGKLVRGKATPPQITMAAILGGLLGFVPGFILVGDLGGGFMQAPGLILTLSFLVLILNANLAVFGIALFLAKILSLVVMPVSFQIGRFLLDGPTQGLFKAMINAPVLAWFGLEHYATTGGLVVGLAFGIGVGWLFLRGIRAFRAKMADVEEGSERYQKLTGKRSVRFLTWVFLGKGKGKKSYRELLDKKGGMPIRIPGVIVVAVAVVALWLGHAFLSGPALRNAMQVGLEYWNGATVDLAEARVDLTEGQVVIAGLGMADPNDLIRDNFRARTLDVKLGTRDLLKKRLVFDTITSQEASTGALRETPGSRVVDPEPPPPAPPDPDSKTLEDYLAEAQKWKERLLQVSRWLQYFAGSDEGDEEPASRDERIDRAAAEIGMARVAASHLIEGAPLVLVRSLIFEGVVAVNLEGDLLDIRASNLSTNPRLVDEPLELTISARSGRFSFGLIMDAAGDETAETTFTFRDIPVDDIAGELSASPIRGGTMDVSLSGSLDCSRPEGVWIDMPLQVRLRNTSLSLEGLQETRIEDLTVPLGLRGPLAAPRVTLDDAVLADALVAAGRRELAGQVRSRADALLEGRLPGAGEQLGGIVGGDRTAEQAVDEAAQRAEEEARRRAEEEARRQAEGALNRVLPGGLPGIGGIGAAPKLAPEAMGHWVHSREEDTAEATVYRPSGFAFPNTDPRAAMEILADGSFVQHTVGADGSITQVRGRWQATRDGFRVEFPDGGGTPRELRILSVNRETLRVMH